jgi:hypothetical protein
MSLQVMIINYWLEYVVRQDPDSFGWYVQGHREDVVNGADCPGPQKKRGHILVFFIRGGPSKLCLGPGHKKVVGGPGYMVHKRLRNTDLDHEWVEVKVISILNVAVLSVRVTVGLRRAIGRGSIGVVAGFQRIVVVIGSGFVAHFCYVRYTVESAVFVDILQHSETKMIYL